MADIDMMEVETVAKDIIDHFKLKRRPCSRYWLCKGFLVKDLLDLGIDAYGVDVSEYALQIVCLRPLEDYIYAVLRYLLSKDSFAAVLSINTLHNLDKVLIKKL